MSPTKSTPRVLLAKVGLDGHDRGIKIVARGLRDSGFHVIYAGMWQTPEAVVQAALDEDADWIGISLLSGAHMTLIPRLLELLRGKGLDDVGVIVGGIIPKEDSARLKELGVATVFGPGTSISEIAEFLRSNSRSRSLPDLEQRIQQQDRRALSRLLTMAAQGSSPATRSSAVVPTRGRRTIALSGSGGVGKSSLIGAIVQFLRQQSQSVAVLCCDPESSLTGGALLGDRVRISLPTEDEGLFIRSLATRSGQQAIAAHLDVMTQRLHDFGFDTVIIETVGAGQGDTAIYDLVDVLVVLLQPESGDELQWEKAGLLEMADIVVVHKADLPGADDMQSRLKDVLNLPGSRTVPILKASAAQKEGLKELWDAIQNSPPHPQRTAKDEAGL